jgi:hypothetical protein
MNNIISQPLSFDNENIRFIVKDGVTYYSVVDVITALIKDDSLINQNPSSYWNKLKNRQLKDVLPIWLSMELMKSNGQFQLSDCSTREQMFEIITYVPSKKVASFRKWLASLGEIEFQRIESGEELPYEKVREKSKRIRNEFTKSLHDHGVFGSDIGGITDDLYRHGYGKSAASYREHKGLRPGTNLRNHMTVNELQVTSVMETLLPQVMDNNNSYGKVMVKHDAVDVGEFGSKMIREMERLLGRPVVSKENNLSPKKKLDTKKDKQLVIE